MPDPADITRLALEEEGELFRLVRELGETPLLRFREGEYLMREGETGADVYLVLQGAYAVECAPERPDQPPVVLATSVCSPESLGVVGEMAYFGNQRRSASVRSCGSSVVLRLEARHVDAVITGYPGLTQVLCRQFSARIRDMNRLLGTLQGRFAMNPRQRMAEAGEVLYRRGEPARTLYQLSLGAVRLEGEGPGRVVHPEDLPEGLLEPAAFFRGTSYLSTATVEGMAFLVAIDELHRVAAARNFPEVVLQALREASEE